MNNQELWNLVRETWTALAPHYEPTLMRLVTEYGLENQEWGLLLAVLTFEPDPTTPAHLLVRGPFTSAELYMQRLTNVSRSGYLEPVEAGKFRLTSQGRAGVNRFIDDLRTAMASADPLPKAKSRYLAELLDKLIQRCLKTTPPPEPWSIRLSYKLMPEVEPPMPYIEQGFSCLAAYRDDAHLAAWQHSGLSATASETLTLLWRGEVNSLDALVKQLEHRGHSLWVYADALAELRTRRLIAGDDGEFTLTDFGKEFRDRVEADTDRYFYAPWACLSEDEKFRMGDILVRMRDGLRASGSHPRQTQ